MLADFMRRCRPPNAILDQDRTELAFAQNFFGRCRLRSLCAHGDSRVIQEFLNNDQWLFIPYFVFSPESGFSANVENLKNSVLRKYGCYLVIAALIPSQPPRARRLPLPPVL